MDAAPEALQLGRHNPERLVLGDEQASIVVTPSPAATIDSFTSGSSLIYMIRGSMPAASHVFTSSRRHRSQPAIHGRVQWWPSSHLARGSAPSWGGAIAEAIEPGHAITVLAVLSLLVCAALTRPLARRHPAPTGELHHPAGTVMTTN